MVFKVASWNVNSISSRLTRVLAFLKRENPDVLCLQELKCVEEKFPTEPLREAGYYSVVHGQKTYNGVAILTRVPPQDVRRGFDDGGDDGQARFVAATVAGMRVCSAYIPNGQAVGTEKFQYKLQWFKRLEDYLTRHHRPADKLCLSGDFNVAPEDRDVHDPELWRGKILFSDPERQALATLMGFGLRDTFRLHHAEPGFYSWWDYRELSFPKDKGLRIDFIFASASLSEFCTGARIDRGERKGEKPSDHAPVLAEFALP
jgi:exodeoxyribonuclease-3